MDRLKQFNTEINRTNSLLTRSPSPKRVPELENENSPLQILCTQESFDNIDVVWDWQSPQAQKIQKKIPKRLIPQSPKVPLRKHPSSNSVQEFEKLKEELQSLKNELAIPDHEESLQLSPIEEAEYKSFIQEFHEEDISELLDDDLNEKLWSCSQQMEENLKSCHARDIPVIKTKFKFKETSASEKILANDSFDELLRTVDIKRLVESPEKDYYQTKVGMYPKNQAIQTQSGMVEFCRTQSFENSMSTEVIPKQCTPDEIESKKKEALLKLASKRKLNSSFTSTQCTMQEIEAKRLQALAKVEAKRQHDIIERKRKEALKKLEMKRQKKAIEVKSSLFSRLN